MPYAPGIQPRGDMYLAQGAQQSAAMGNQALFALAQDMIGRGRQQKLDAFTALALAKMGQGAPADGGNGADQLNPADDEAGQGPEDVQAAADLRGKKADAIRKVFGAYNPQSATAIKGMSLEELEGNMKALTIGSALQEHAARMQQLQTQTRLQQAQANLLGVKAQMDADEPAALAKFAALMSQSGQGAPPNLSPEDMKAFAAAGGDAGAGAPAPMADRMWSAFAQMGATNPRLQAAAIGKLLPKLLESGRPAFFDSGSPVQDLPGLPGYKRVVTGPNAAQVVAAGGPQLVTLTDDNGNTRTVLQTPKGGAQALPEPKSATVPESFHKAIDAVMGSDDYNGALQTANDPDAKPKDRAAAQRQLAGFQDRLKGIVDRYHAAGNIPDSLRDTVYQQIGLKTPGAPAPGGTGGEPDASVAKGLALPMDGKGKPDASQMKDGATYLVGGKPYTWVAKKGKLVAAGN